MFVIGTAGHVDHGKSALIHALTGIDPDRLKEEKERGMTIDLGFAWMKLDDGQEVGIVDVPGHEKFIKNMLAGVGYLDLVLLVVAANEGIKQQTIEHLEILNLLNIKKGIKVINKKDLVDADMITLVQMEIADLVKGTFLEDAPFVITSAITGEGISDLKREIESVLKKVTPRPDIGRPRLYVDRVFSIAGSGTIVTGTLIDGSLSVGQEVEILPGKLTGRIRSIQSHKTTKNKVFPVSRVALNLANITAQQINRGDLIALPGTIVTSKRLYAKLHYLAENPHPLRHGGEVIFFIGSDEVVARIHVLDSEEINPGETRWIQISTDNPICAVKGDHFIIRSTMRTLGGGVILLAPAGRHRRYDGNLMSNLKQLESAFSKDAVKALINIQKILSLEQIVFLLNFSNFDITIALKELLENGEIIGLQDDREQIFVSMNWWESAKDRMVHILSSYHKEFPQRKGMPKSEILSKFKLPYGNLVLDKMIKDKQVVDDIMTVRLSNHKIILKEEQESIIELFLTQLESNPYAPNPQVIPDEELINMLVEQKKIVKVAPGIYFSKRVFDNMLQMITKYIEENGEISVAKVRDMFNTSRKYALAFMEYLDNQKITRRIGDVRKLRR